MCLCSIFHGRIYIASGEISYLFFFVLYIDQALGENSAFKRSLQLMVKYALWRP